jgi:ribosomal protein S6--L-glutamate ligase
MRLFFLLVRRVPDVPSPLLVEVSKRLSALGYQVESGIPEQMSIDGRGISPGHDLYLLKSHTEMALSVASVLDAQSARFLNPYPACAAAQDKLLANRRLHAAGVPVPRTQVVGELKRITDLLDGQPKIVKPIRGHRGAGVRVVTTPADLAGLPEPTGPLIVQDQVLGPGEDLKVYVVGQRVWAVRKPFSSTSFAVPGRPVPVTREIEKIALSAATASGLGLFGLDLIEGPEGPVVVDLNYFPGYKGCVDVAGPMTEYIHQYATGELELTLPPLPAVPHPVILHSHLL